MGRKKTVRADETDDRQADLFGDRTAPNTAPPDGVTSQPETIQSDQAGGQEHGRGEPAVEAPEQDSPITPQPETPDDNGRPDPAPYPDSDSDSDSDSELDSDPSQGGESTGSDQPAADSKTEPPSRVKRTTKRGDLHSREQFEFPVFSELLNRRLVTVAELSGAAELTDLTFERSMVMPDDACEQLDPTIALMTLELLPICAYEWSRPGDWTVIANSMSYGLAKSSLPADTQVNIVVPPTKRMAKQFLRYEIEFGSVMQMALLSKNINRAIRQSGDLLQANGRPFPQRLRAELLAVTTGLIRARKNA